MNPTIAQLRNMKLADVRDINGLKRARNGATHKVQYKIANVNDAHASRCIVADVFGRRQIIRSCDAQWWQFLHNGF